MIVVTMMFSIFSCFTSSLLELGAASAQKSKNTFGAI